MPQHAVKCVERCLRVPDAYIQQSRAHIEKHNISMRISTGCTETDALAFSSWGATRGLSEMRMTAHTVPVCLGGVLWALAFMG